MMKINDKNFKLNIKLNFNIIKNENDFPKLYVRKSLSEYIYIFICETFNKMK